MRRNGDAEQGAARPPLCLSVLSARGLRVLLSAFALLFAANAHAQMGLNECRYVQSGPLGAEGFDGPDMFGFRLTIIKDGWGWAPAHGGAVAGCPLCGGELLAKGIMRIGIAPFYPPSDDYQLRRETGQQEASAVDFALHPRTISVGLWSMTNFTPRGVAPETEIMPIRMFGLDGKARVVTILSSGNPVHGIAVAIEDRCFKYFGIFFREDNGPVKLSDLLQVDEIIKLERFTPRFSLDQLTPRPLPRPWVQFPLGDARKQWQEEQDRAQNRERDPAKQP